MPVGSGSPIDGLAATLTQALAGNGVVPPLANTNAKQRTEPEKLPADAQSVWGVHPGPGQRATADIASVVCCRVALSTSRRNSTSTFARTTTLRFP